MFTQPFELQQKHFDKVISDAVNNVNQFDNLLPELQELGDKHRGKGIIDEHFILVKSAFLLALQNILNIQYTEDIGNAWGKYIDQISNVIKQRI